MLREYEAIPVWPASHYVTEKPKVKAALKSISEECEKRVAELKATDKLLEAQRLQQRTDYDLEMLETMGFCNGIENYSRHLDGRKPGEPPFTLIDYFPKDMLCIIDESHVTVPQIRGMHEGDRSRKVTLVEHGFRLPSALDNRPLRFDEFEARIPQFIYVSATPGDYELRVSQNDVEQIIRPTGLLDPKIDVRPVRGQIDDLEDEIRERVARKERVLVTTLTKRMAEDLTDHLLDAGIKVNYMHSDTATMDRVEILRTLREGKIDVLVGINLLREGLDLPEVSLVAILDADKEGFLRNRRSLSSTSPVVSSAAIRSCSTFSPTSPKTSCSICLTGALSCSAAFRPAIPVGSTACSPRNSPASSAQRSSSAIQAPTMSSTWSRSSSILSCSSKEPPRSARRRSRVVAYLSRASQHPVYARAALSTPRFTSAAKRSTSTPIAEALTLRGHGSRAFALQAACSRAVYNQKRIRAVWDTGRPLSCL